MAQPHDHLHAHDHSRASSHGDTVGDHAGHDHSHPHAHSHAHDHAHSHGPHAPHPSQDAPWSLLRMSLAGRLIVALGASMALWGAVLLAMR